MSEETYLYIIGETNPWAVKIGISSDPQARVVALQSGHHSRLVLHRAYPYPDRMAAEAAERYYHDFFQDARMCGEWFGISLEEAAMGIEEAHTWPVPPLP